jgi:hypothetical protein
MLVRYQEERLLVLLARSVLATAEQKIHEPSPYTQRREEEEKKRERVSQVTLFQDMF